MQIKLNVKRSVEQNAAEYFEKAKKAKKKLEGIRQTIAKYEKELEKLQEKAQAEAEKETAAQEEKETLKARPKSWYHSFRWFVTSDGFVVAGGRDATTNEAIVKKHTDAGDLLLHTDMAGSPFFVIKSAGKKISETAKKQTADATCTFSRAWKLRMPKQDVFCARPEQVTKTPKSGEYLQRGAFVIEGKVEYIENKTNLAVGLDKDRRVMAGPVEAVSAHCERFIALQQGDKRPSDIAKQIKHKLGAGDLDEIIRALPAGEFKFKEPEKKKA